MKQFKKINIALAVILLFAFHSACAQTNSKKPNIDIDKIKQARERVRTKANEQQGQLQALQLGSATNTTRQNNAAKPTVSTNQAALKPKQDQH
jgi:hypothetical protein